MNKLFIDFETRSDVDLKKTSAWVYAEGNNTDVQCLALKMGEAPGRIWVPDRYRGLLTKTIPTCDQSDVLAAIAWADEIHAHNVEFEKALWHWVCHLRWGWPDLPIEKLRCTAAKAAACGLPRSLGEVSRVLGCRQEKDNQGYRIMLKLCKPRSKEPLVWWEDPQDLNALFRYCIQDVEAEAEVDGKLPDLSPDELEVWQLDQRINTRGVRVDLDRCEQIIGMIEKYSEGLLTEYAELSGGRVLSPRQVAATLKMLDEEEGVKLPDLKKNTVAEALTGDLSPRAARLLEIRRLLAKASTAKYKAAKRLACSDGRLRSILMYHGAGTGRWSGKGMQLHNLPRGSFKDIDTALATLDAGAQWVELLYPDLLTTASTLLRSMIIADGEFFVSDFKAIEGCVLSWLAKDDMIDVYRTGDPYKVAASWIYEKAIDAINKDERQVGKVAELALGYQGGVHALETMANGYGVVLTDDQKERIVKTWRARRPATVRYWYDIEAMAKAVVLSREPRQLGAVKYAMGSKTLNCILPSGRVMRYFCPAVLPDPEYKGRTKLTYWGVDSETKRWMQIETYGGKLVENIVQAVARDLLAEAMVRLSRAGFVPALHVHDEVVADVAAGTGDDRFQDFSRIMAEVPTWATGCPIAVESWRGKRYRK